MNTTTEQTPPPSQPLQEFPHPPSSPLIPFVLMTILQYGFFIILIMALPLWVFAHRELNIPAEPALAIVFTLFLMLSTLITIYRSYRNDIHPFFYDPKDAPKIPRWMSLPTLTALILTTLTTIVVAANPNAPVSNTRFYIILTLVLTTILLSTITFTWSIILRRRPEQKQYIQRGMPLTITFLIILALMLSTGQVAPGYPIFLRIILILYSIPTAWMIQKRYPQHPIIKIYALIILLYNPILILPLPEKIWYTLSVITAIFITTTAQKTSTRRRPKPT